MSVLLTESGEDLTLEDGEDILLEDSEEETGATIMTVAHNLTGDGYATYPIKPRR